MSERYVRLGLLGPSYVEQQARRFWLAQATHVHFGCCSSCGRTDDDSGRPLLVARQPYRRAFECVDCFDQREAS